jgi:hypothetical protein
VTIGVLDHFWVFNAISLIFPPVFVPIPHRFYHNCSVVQLEVRNGDSTRGSFIVENSFHYPGFFVNLNEFANALSNSMKNWGWNFDGDCIESVDCFSCKLYMPQYRGTPGPKSGNGWVGEWGGRGTFGIALEM